MTIPRTFFFPHARKSDGVLGGRPGRVPFEVIGDLVDGSSTRKDRAVVCADGYGFNQCASNQDPCVFCKPLGPLHSFCRVDAPRGKDHYVLELSGTQERFLSDVVRPDDRIFYGKTEPPASGEISRIWVDTMVVVRRRIRWPATRKQAASTSCGSGAGACKRRRFQLRAPAAFADTIGVTPTSDLFKFHLRDAEAGGTHCCTANRDPHVIEGAVDPTSSAVRTGATSFVTLAQQCNGEWWPAFVAADDLHPADWVALKTFFEGKVRRNPRSGFISEMDSALGLKLLAAVVASSGRGQGMPGTVAVPPLTPSAATMRWSPSSRTFVEP
jgi:hypothetical protein